MSDDRTLPQARRFERFWDALVSGRTVRPKDELDLDPDVVAAARRLQALNRPAPVDPTLEARIWEDLMQSHALGATIPLRPTRLPHGNGRTHVRHPAIQPRPAHRPRPLAAGLSWMATLTLLAVVLAMIFFVFHNGQPAVTPAVQESPTAEPTPIPAPDPHAWSMFGGNAARTRIAADAGPRDEPTVRWTYPTSGTENVFSSIDRGASADGVLYAAGDTGFVIAIDVATGQERWRVQGYGGTVVVDGDGLIVHGNVPSAPNDQPTNLARLDRADGSLVWLASDIPLQPSWNPAVSEGIGYVPSGTDFVAFDPATGDVLWRVPLKAAASRGAAVASGLIVFGDEQGTVYGLSTAGGDTIWTYQIDAMTIGHPAIAAGTAYVNGLGGTEDAFYAIDTATGALKWRYVAPDGAGFRGPAVDGETVYVTTFGPTLYALDAATGALKWTFDTGAANVNSPAVAGDALYLSSDAGVGYALDTTTGTELWRLPLDSAANSGSIVADGVYYLSTDAGTIYAIGDAGSTTETGATPVATATPAPTATPMPAAAGTAPQVELVWSTNLTTTEQLIHPLIIRRSPDGHLWVPDLSNRFYIFDLDGNLEEIWGEPGSGPGQFAFQSPDYEIANLAFAADGSFYVIDPFNYRIQHFDRDRVYLGEWGSRGTGDGQFLILGGITVEADGTILVTDYGRADIQRFDPNGVFLSKFDGTGTPDGKLDGPIVPAVDAGGRIYVVETDANRVRIFDHDGKQLDVLGAGGPDFGGLHYPLDVAIDENGYAYVVDSYNHRIVVFDPDGRYVFAWGEYGSGDGQFNTPGGIAVNRGGTVYVDDWHGNRIVKFKITGPFPAPTAATPVS
jgi:outer membrane protein assembly factor BamB